MSGPANISASFQIGVLLSLVPLMHVYALRDQISNESKPGHVAALFTGFLYAAGFAAVAGDSSNSLYIFMKRLELMPVGTISYFIGANLPAILMHYFFFIRPSKASSYDAQKKSGNPASSADLNNVPTAKASEGKDSGMDIVKDQQSDRYWYQGISYGSLSEAELARSKNLELKEKEKLTALGIEVDHAGRYWVNNRPYSSKEQAIDVARESHAEVNASEQPAERSFATEKSTSEQADPKPPASRPDDLEKISIAEMAEALRIIAGLHKDGLLSDSEFAEKKAGLLRKI